MSTEGRNIRTMDLDHMSTLEFLKVMNEEDQLVPVRISEVLEDIEEMVSSLVETFKQGGRLIYIGAGTSGRLGVLDAVECVPTFSTPPEMVQGLIAGGERAFVRAVEGAEDSKELAEQDLEEINLSAYDMVIGIAASGRTPYVIGGLDYANQVGARTGAISCNQKSLISKHADTFVEVNLGPEVLTGSTRLKAGSAQKMILNMISTASMIAIGKTYGNLMVDVMATNEKLVDRAKRIIVEATGVSYEIAEKFYEASGGKPKVAIVMIIRNCSLEEAIKRLESGFVSKAIED
ncbi:N-acetylmuramic acid 6-phosphate etherase [Acidaminobacter sp. JC074]|uniref:N-acetylmuramic acid 6-phosphate etherase n=1 Tax=Acidaminobacter sp. JC074 TaxID=2530199 RepID=UPI001F0EF8FB|nr:N-acetylmuramic acid 6-phosphate etherase [Acidaminobacter sp. JC074]MCH4887476.1 N-acetylmuramic acid 6-phosphate etherase [Acidaminobacter sp. JC074]